MDEFLAFRLGLIEAGWRVTSGIEVRDVDKSWDTSPCCNRRNTTCTGGVYIVQ